MERKFGNGKGTMTVGTKGSVPDRVYVTFTGADGDKASVYMNSRNAGLLRDALDEAVTEHVERQSR